MANNAGEAEVDIRPNLQDFGRRLTTAMRPALNSAGRMGSGLGSSLTRALLPSFRTIAAAGTAAFAGIAVAGATTVGLGLKVAANMEQARIGFTTMLGSAKEADKFLRQLAAFAAKTPFEFPDVVEGSQRLLAMGFNAKAVIPIMTAVGDSVAAIGGGSEEIQRVTLTLGQIQAKGRLQAEEMMQLNEAGVFSWQKLADAMGVSVPKAMDKVSEGAVSSAEFMEAFMTSTADNFGGMMAKQSKSLVGLLSTAKDTIMMQFGDVSGPLVTQLKRSLPDVTKAVSGLIKSVGPSLFQFVGQLAKVVVGLLPILQPVIKVLATAFGQIASALLPVLKDLAPIVVRVAEAFVSWLTAFTPLLEPLGSLMGLIGGIVATLAEQIGVFLVAAVKTLAPALAPLIQAFSQILQALLPILPALIDLLVAMLPILPPVIRLATALLTLLLPVLRLVVGFLTKYVIPAMEAILPVISTVIGAVASFASSWGHMWETIKNATVAVWNTIKSALSGAWNWIVSTAKTTWDGILRVFNAVKDRIVEAVLWPFRRARDLIGAIWRSFYNFLRIPANAVLSGIEGFINGIRAAINWVASKFGINSFAAHIEVPGMPALAKGTRDWQGGWAVVGERGPEVAFLPRHAAVIPAEQSQRLLSGMAGALPGFAVGLPPDPSAPPGPGLNAGDDILRWLTAGSLLGNAVQAAKVVAEAFARFQVAAPQLLGVFGSIGAAALSFLKDKFIGAVAGWLKDALGLGFGGFIGEALGPGIVTAIVRSVATGYGWGSGSQWAALTQIIAHESGWNPNAQNPTSTAYGLFQFLDSTWASVGGFKTADPRLQTIFGLRYIAQRYGSPSAAWAFWQAHNWYGDGGEGIVRKPTLIGVGDKGPEAFRVTPLSAERRDDVFGDGMPIEVHFHAPIYTESPGKFAKVLARKLAPELSRELSFLGAR